ncbi:MAG TPA: L,D-transpeptidase [Halomonas sp.]|nr:L,D-transpeptidase [Halomonas sp.]
MSLTRRGFVRLAALGAALAAAGAAEAQLLQQVRFEPAAELGRRMEERLRKASRPRYAQEVWVLVDNRESRLRVYRGDALIESFFPVSLGRGGAKFQRYEGGRATPLGEFRVTRFNPRSKFHMFIGLDYPTPFHARQALETGVYSQQDYADYFDYYRRYGSPPQQTVLGGFIGIHGLGEANPDIHRRLHWTDGCVAVEDSQINRLSLLVDIGTRVVIR